MRAHQELVDAQLDFAADLAAASRGSVSSVWLTVPSVEFSTGTTPKSAMPGLDLVEHLVDRRQRQRAHRVAEVLEHGGLRERALGPEEADLQRLFLREAGGHDLAEQPQDFFVAQRTLVALARHAQHLRFALGAVEIDGVAVGVLGDADLPRELRALVEQRVDLRVDGVDLRAQARASGAGSLLPARLAACLRVLFFFALAMRPSVISPARASTPLIARILSMTPRRPPRHRYR